MTLRPEAEGPRAAPRLQRIGALRMIAMGMGDEDV